MFNDDENKAQQKPIVVPQQPGQPNFLQQLMAM
jgi:hypothetical protein